MEKRSNFIWSVIIAFLIGIIAFPLSRTWFSQDLSYQILLIGGSALLCGVVTFAILHFFELDPFIRRALTTEHKKLNALQKARIVIHILLQYSDEEITFTTTVGNWIKLLTVGTEFAERDWFSTYLIAVTDWPRFGRIATDYNETLKQKNIHKVRCIIRHPIPSNICQSELVIDSKSAGIEIKIYDSDSVRYVSIPEEDYAVFDEKYVIVGYPKRGKLEVDDKVKVKLKVGAQVGPYLFTKANLLRRPPDYEC